MVPMDKPLKNKVLHVLLVFEPEECRECDKPQSSVTKLESVIRSRHSYSRLLAITGLCLLGLHGGYHQALCLRFNNAAPDRKKP